MSEMLSMPKRFGTLLCADSTVFEENTIEEFFRFHFSFEKQSQ